jgi:hypothetical protein
MEKFFCAKPDWVGHSQSPPLLIDGTLPYGAKAVCGAGSLEAKKNCIYESIGQGE